MAKQPTGLQLTVDTMQSDTFDTGDRFVNLQPVGYGANGLVFAATDKTCDKRVAIKKIRISDQRCCRQALREIRILKRLEHDNVILVYEILGAKGRTLEEEAVLADSKSVYIVQELMDTNLHELMQHEQLQQEHIKLFLYQFLRGLKYIHSANVLHRDLKPTNLLVNYDDLLLKIGDFGLARIIDPEYNHKGQLTQNVGTCWYKSPEMLLGSANYGSAADIWSAGCIFAEMLNSGQPLFAGMRDLDQLRLVVDSIPLSDADWSHVLRIMPNKMLRNHPLKVQTPLVEKLDSVCPAAMDLLQRMLAFNPLERITVVQALSHPYLAEFACPHDEPVAMQPLCIELEIDDMPSSTLKQLIYNEAVLPAVTCGSREPPRPTSSSSPQQHHDTQYIETHTLEEIFHLDYFESGTDASSHKDTFNSIPCEVEEQDENIGRKNLKNSREKLCGSTTSDGSWLDNDNIIELCVGEDGAPTDTHDCSSCNMTKKGKKHADDERADDDDDEKDIAEISPEKLEEDRQLEIINMYHETIVEDGSNLNDSTDVKSTDCFLHLVPLTVNVENVKEYAPISKEGDENAACDHILHVEAEDVPDECHWNTEKEMEKDVKNVSDSREKSKSNRADRLLKKKSGRHRSTGNNLDERYRLPTEHLRTDTDYSNERLKQKRLAKVFHSMKHNQELNERLKQNDETEWYGWYPPESELVGATAWYDFEDDHTYEANYGLATLTERSITTMRQLENDHKNYQTVNTPTLTLSPTEPQHCSSQSPERPSGEETRAGARPKKVSTKQRAL